MLSAALLEATKEVMRRCQAAPTSPQDLSERLCMLLRVSALTSANPRATVSEVRDKLRPFIADLHILEALTGRVLELLDGDDVSRDAIEPELDALLDEVREAESELAEQTSTLLSAGDKIVILAEAPGSFIEAAIRDAAETIVDAHKSNGSDDHCDSNGNKKCGDIDDSDDDDTLDVRIVRIGADSADVAGAMHKRLNSVRGVRTRVVQDARIGRALRGACKVILGASGLDADDGAVCARGAALVCAAANRMRVGVVVATARHRMAPVGSCVVGVVGLQGAGPGEVWEYGEARGDRRHAAVAVVAQRYDVVALQKVDVVVTEYGGYAAEYVKSLAPNVESVGNGDVQG